MRKNVISLILVYIKNSCVYFSCMPILSTYDERHSRGYFIMQLRRRDALGTNRRILHLSCKRITEYREEESAISIQKIARGFLVRTEMNLSSYEYITL